MSHYGTVGLLYGKHRKRDRNQCMVSFLLSYVIGAYTGQNSVDHPVFCFIALFLLTIYSHDVAYRILADFRTKLYDKIEELSPTFLKRSRSGNILSIMMDDVNLLEWFYAHTFGVLLIDLSSIRVLCVAAYLVQTGALSSQWYLVTNVLFWKSGRIDRIRVLFLYKESIDVFALVCYN